MSTEAEIRQLKTLVEALKARLDENEGGQTISVPGVPAPSPIDTKNGDIKKNIEFFQKQWENYVVGNKLRRRPMNEQKSILFATIGDECYKRYLNWTLTAAQTASTETILQAITDNLAPKVNKRYERVVFNRAKQETNESYDEYFDRLRALISSCQYGESKDDFLLDKIIYSIQDEMMSKTLSEDRDITLEKAIDKCKSRELSNAQMKSIKAPQEDDEVKKLRQYQSFKRYENQSRPIQPRNQQKEYKQRTQVAEQRPNQPLECKYCGYNHNQFQRCPAKDAQCHICQKVGHFARMCMSRRKTVKTLEDAEEGDLNDEFVLVVLKIGDNSKRRLERGIRFIIDENKTTKVEKCQLDTGATCSIIGLNNFCELMGHNNPIMEPTKVKIWGFGDGVTVPLGKAKVKCWRDDRHYEIIFQIVECDHMPLLSWEKCEEMGLIKVCPEIEEVRLISEDKTEPELLIRKYQQVFEGLGELEGEVEIELKNDVRPFTETPRRVPITKREVMRRELDQMEKIGVIVKENQHTDFCSNILIVERNNKVRICLDPTRLNECIKSPKLQLPRIEEILPELNKAKVFTTLDAKRGFWQLRLTEESSKLTTFWTPFGRYRFIRMPFGIAPAMEIYQQRMNEIVAGLDGVEVMADDILVYGKGEDQEQAMKDHNRNLENLLIRVRARNLTLNKEKVKLCQKSVQYFGHVLTSEGVKTRSIESVDNHQHARTERKRRHRTNSRNDKLPGQIHPKFVERSRAVEKNDTSRCRIFVATRRKQSVQSNETTHRRSTDATLLRREQRDDNSNRRIIVCFGLYSNAKRVPHSICIKSIDDNREKLRTN
jgi:Reverse transcriptase (RNA-dependent DNA polymerase)